MAKLINPKSWSTFSAPGTAGGIVLFLCLILSLLIANSPLAESFNNFLSTEIGFHSESLHLKYSISLWINDGLMAIFFLMVGLEIKRELIEGELSTPKKALLPILCAIGGAILPALIYYFLNYGKPTSSGWGIPMATDIAFALAVVTLLGKRVPASLKIFLAALAIVDDLMAILVIAIFYSLRLNFTYLLLAGGVFLLLMLFNRLKLKNLFFYIIPGLFLWYFIHNSGIHATIAGVLTALALPTTPDSSESPLEKLEHALVKPVNFIIVPLFALANTNIHIESKLFESLFSSLGIGILLGLLIGKPIGIIIISWLSVKLKICKLPANSNWTHILGIGLLGGIGFTMSIFISLLSFSDTAVIAEAKFAILIASVVSGILGYSILRINSKRKNARKG